MHKIYSNKGFTLIEIIVVLIIVGILAAIALPNLFANVDKSRAAAAIAAMDGVKSQIETCAYQNNITVTNPSICAPDNFGLPNDGAPPIQGFTFVISGLDPAPPSTNFGATVVASGTASAGNLTYTIMAMSAGYEYGISLTRATNGTFSCSAPLDGPYAGAC